MDISIIGENSIKLKGKRTTFIVDPAKKMPKTTADAIILLGNGNSDIDISRVTDFRIIIDGPGSYEVGGVKISGTKTPKSIIYRLSIDGMSIVLGFATDVKIEGFNVCQIEIINTSIDFNETFVTALEPKLTILYGEKKVESAKTLGGQNIAPVSKITVTKDKLPEEMQISILN